jgi:hypothetical protein
MQLVFSNHPTPLTITSSIFLAGPTPRSPLAVDWRRDAVNLLEELGYTGTVFIPCPDFIWNNDENVGKWDYDKQILWEIRHRNIADKIVFWVPRSIEGQMPAFTTNIEFGEDIGTYKVIYGRPDDAEKCKYMDKKVTMRGDVFFTDLKVMLEYTLEKLGSGSVRKNGEIFIPLFVWNSQYFKSWYKNLTDAGNNLVEAKVLSSFKVGDNLFSFSLWVNIFIKDENRMKANEIVFSRPDVSSVVAYYREEKQIKFLVVKEFRSNVNNKGGYVLEIPSGSSFNPDFCSQKIAQHELVEEAGILIKDIERLKLVETKQVAATLSTFKNSVYSVELQKDEIEHVKMLVKSKAVLGEDEQERIQLLTMTLDEIYSSDMDWGNIGIIATVVKGLKLN